MNLSEAATDALDRWSEHEATIEDMELLCDVMFKLFPVRTCNGLLIRWDDEITPERLVASGFRVGDVSYGWYGLQYYPLEKRWWYSGFAIHRDFAPRNMGEVWRFMERCGIEVPNEHA